MAIWRAGVLALVLVGLPPPPPLPRARRNSARSRARPTAGAGSTTAQGELRMLFVSAGAGELFLGVALSREGVPERAMLSYFVRLSGASAPPGLFARPSVIALQFIEGPEFETEPGVQVRYAVDRRGPNATFLRACPPRTRGRSSVRSRRRARRWWVSGSAAAMASARRSGRCWWTSRRVSRCSAPRSRGSTRCAGPAADRDRFRIRTVLDRDALAPMVQRDKREALMTLGQQARWWGIGFALFVAVLWVLSDILAPFLLGAAIAYLCNPFVDRLQRLGLSRTLSTVIVTGVGIAC